MTDLNIITGDCLTVLKTLPDGCVQCCVTSPPYFGLRDYGHAGQIGLEQTPADYVAKLVSVFSEVRRVLADDGTLWLNLGDSYANNWNGSGGSPSSSSLGQSDGKPGRGVKQWEKESRGHKCIPPGLKAKDLIGIPWRVAFALQADGWYLRSDIIWHKPNPMPESITDRPTKSHEYLFLLTKSSRYYYDCEAIKEPVSELSRKVHGNKYNAKDYDHKYIAAGLQTGNKQTIQKNGKHRNLDAGRNRRTVWTIATQPTPDAHFATFPEALVRPCIQAGSRIGDLILDPFGGSGTTAKVALQLGRRATLIELNPAYVAIAERKTNVMPNLI